MDIIPPDGIFSKELNAIGIPALDQKIVDAWAAVIARKVLKPITRVVADALVQSIAEAQRAHAAAEAQDKRRSKRNWPPAPTGADLFDYIVWGDDGGGNCD